MDLSVLIIAISLSIDALGIGISYGVREIKIPLISKVIISLQSFLIMTISLFLGNIIFDIIPTYLGKYIGVIILFGMGIFMIIRWKTTGRSSGKRRKRLQLNRFH